MLRVQTAQEKQGDLGDLRQKTKAELLDLLVRQEKLLANKKFLNQLKDKGAKVESFAEKLRTLIAEREEVDKAMQLFERMDIGKVDDTITDVSERHQPPQEFTKDTAVHAGNERTSAESHKELITSPRTDEESPAKQDRKEKFKPNRDLKSTAIPSDLPRPNVRPSPSKDQSSKEKLVGENKDEELSAVVIPPLRNQEAQVVEMAESANLLLEQKKAAEALLAKQAAERLTERLNVKMGDFLPQVHGASYRNQVDDSDDDSAESDNEDESGDEEEDDD